jgi:hypothetical protein
LGDQPKADGTLLWAPRMPEIYPPSKLTPPKVRLFVDALRKGFRERSSYRDA